jgi:DNA-binding NarL/FixJ family response regulator
MIRVLLVDDHPVVRLGYRRLLEQAGDIGVVAEAANTDAGYEAFLTHSRAGAVDVSITDLSMPGSGGLELMRKMLAHRSKAKVLVFSMYDAPELVRRALAGGACGFVSKNADPDNLVMAVRRAHGGQRYLSENLSPDLLRLRPDDEPQRLNGLSQREFEIFRLLAQGSSAAECARALNLSPKTVANHQTLIKEKLGVTTSAALVHLALRNSIIAPWAP